MPRNCSTETPRTLASLGRISERGGLSLCYQKVMFCKRCAERTAAGAAQPCVPCSAYPTLVRVLRATELAATMAVRVGRAEVQVRRGFDADLLRAVVEALQGDAA